MTQRFPDNPNERPGFEIRILKDGERWSRLIPEYYPDRLKQTKAKKLERDGRQCGGEDISIEKVKNREIHISGIILESEIIQVNSVLDHEGAVELISPLTPRGGMECIVKNGEIGETKGWDPDWEQWTFEYTMDFVSTGKDEYNRENNGIVSAIMD